MFRSKGTLTNSSCNLCNWFVQRMLWWIIKMISGKILNPQNQLEPKTLEIWNSLCNHYTINIITFHIALPWCLTWTRLKTKHEEIAITQNTNCSNCHVFFKCFNALLRKKHSPKLVKVPLVPLRALCAASTSPKACCLKHLLKNCNA